MVTAKRQQRDSSRGADITVRCLKRERERIKWAARSEGQTLNRFMLDAALVEVMRVADRVAARSREKDGQAT
jgi:uncharacterized protein (DUF1778 family)